MNERANERTNEKTNDVTNKRTNHIKQLYVIRWSFDGFPVVFQKPCYQAFFKMVDNVNVSVATISASFQSNFRQFGLLKAGKSTKYNPPTSK